MRKAALSLLVAAAAIAAPLASFGSFAQPANGPVTRAEVVAQLSRLELVGYKPFKSAYPDDMQAAEVRRPLAREPDVSSAIAPLQLASARRCRRANRVESCPADSHWRTPRHAAVAAAPAVAASVIRRTLYHRAAADVPLAPLPGHARPILSISDLAAPVAIAASTPEVCHVPSAACTNVRFARDGA